MYINKNIYIIILCYGKLDIEKTSEKVIGIASFYFIFLLLGIGMVRYCMQNYLNHPFLNGQISDRMFIFLQK